MIPVFLSFRGKKDSLPDGIPKKRFEACYEVLHRKYKNQGLVSSKFCRNIRLQALRATYWPAYSKWNLDYMAEIAGDKEVPLYDDRPVDYKDGFNEPHAKMQMSEYIDLLKREPTRYRIFLWNILKEVPELQNDFSYPDFGLKLMKGLPMLFFGGEDSYTPW